MQNWSLREQINRIAGRWYFGAAAFLLGALAGFGAAWVLPAEYEARAGLYVGFNADAEFMTPDDYKNWQMEELEAFVLSDPVLEETRSRLAASGDDFASLDVADLRRSLVPRWRNAGAWHLAARAADPERAVRMAQVWSEVVLEQTGLALEQAAAFNETNFLIETMLRRLTDRRWDIQELETIEKAFRDFAGEITAESAVEMGQQAALRSLSGRLAGIHAPWGKLPEAPEGDDGEAYLAWIDANLEAVEFNLEVQATLEKQVLNSLPAMRGRWLEEKTASRGLSAFLLVEALVGEPPQVETLRSEGLMTLAGGSLGLLGWITAQLVSAFWRREAPA